jgi:hypothetical protein
MAREGRLFGSPRGASHVGNLQGFDRGRHHRGERQDWSIEGTVGSPGFHETEDEMLSVWDGGKGEGEEGKGRHNEAEGDWQHG